MFQRRQKIEYFLIAILIIGIFLIGNSFLKQLNFPDSNYQLEKGKRVEIIPGEILQQKFVASQNGLSNLKILFSGKSLAKDYTLDLILADEKCQAQIRKTTLLGGQEFNSKNLYDFKFSPVDNSKSKRYCLIVDYKTTAKNPKKRAVRLFENVSAKQDGSPVPVSKMNVNKKEGGKEAGVVMAKYIISNVNLKKKKIGEVPIVFRPSYKKDKLTQNFHQLNARMSQYKPWFLKGRYLTEITVLTIILAMGSIAMLANRDNK